MSAPSTSAALEKKERWTAQDRSAAPLGTTQTTTVDFVGSKSARTPLGVSVPNSLPQGSPVQSATPDDDIASLPPPPAGTARRCLSLRVLNKLVTDSLAEGKPVPKECLNLAGISFVEGYLVQEDEVKDLILFGLVTTNRPSLHLDDLVVFLRSASRNDSPPSCSLDPVSENNRRLDHLMGSLRSLPRDPNSLTRVLSNAVGPQIVWVGGVPTNSRIAHVMIDADYHMKKVSQGHLSLPGITSPLDIRQGELGASAIPSNNRPINRSRFWFHLGADAPAFEHDEGVVRLTHCPVALLTKKQLQEADGKLSDDASGEDSRAEKFAQLMSYSFTDLARRVPEYADLENLYRLRAIVLAIQHRDDLGKSDLRMDMEALLFSGQVGDEGPQPFFANYHYQAEHPMPLSYPGLANCRVTGSLISMVAGGVAMDMPVATQHFKPAAGKRLLQYRMRVIEARPKKDSLFWPIPEYKSAGIYSSPAFLYCFTPFRNGATTMRHV